MVFAIVVAGGSGTRMKTEIPKQFCLLNDKPLFYYCLKSFVNTFSEIRIILVLPEAYIHPNHPYLDVLKEFKHITLIAGGQNRFESVRNGLNQIHEDGIVFIHDAVRPFINAELLMRCFKEAELKGNAIPSIEIKDSLRQVMAHQNKAVFRDDFRSIQTPQTFKSSLIKAAFNQPYQEFFTDDASVLESFGEKINLIEGLDLNLKITTPLDLIVAQSILNQSKTV